MLASNSRYTKLRTLTLQVTDKTGDTQNITYLERRFLPSPEDLTTLVQHTVAQGERLDNIAYKYLGDATLFWRLCDANNVFKPEELTAEAGEAIQIAMKKIRV